MINGQFWGWKGQIGQENGSFDIFNSYCFKQIILVLFMVFSDEDLIFQESIVMQAILPISVFDTKKSTTIHKD